ncbi:protein kinase domain-containing protein [Hyalangium rubrum]|uniref:Protein kinase n=1 Tax=Hyalangium rubrum TaxID=3103134 RepID=A0ABU5HKD0_9BACT|nr:protein kinase [Hyalangium sp. s54d21]MDY7232525.1 protein kinase [Hyalangium sp. s54d21]
MSHIGGHEEENALPLAEYSLSRGDSEFEDSFLRELVWQPPPVPMPVLGERLGGLDGSRYEILELIGQGGMGQVFRALDHELQRTVALKFLLSFLRMSPQQVTALLREEAQAIARLDHDNIVRIHDLALWNTGFRQKSGLPPAKVPFLVMEYLEGKTLQSILMKGRLELRRALDIMLDVGAGLAHAHERHLVHLDLKPGNVFILAQGRAKLLDFGLSRLLTGGTFTLDTTGSGTPPYMSPAQWRREPPHSCDDTWSCGVLLFEMLTGQLPFPSLESEEIQKYVTSARPMPSVRERRPELPVELDKFIASTLDKTPGNRPPDGSELLKRLCALQENLALRPRRVRAVAERRQVTLVACRLSLASSSGVIDPEDFSELEESFHRACTRLIQQAGGTITTAMGAEVLASFGYPRLQEDDSEHAVRAALRQTQELPRELLSHWRQGLSVRVGIHTDLVALSDVMPEFHGMTPAMQGEGPRIASWLATQAEAGTVLLSDQAYALVRGRFHTRFLGQRTFEALSGPQSVGLHQVLHERRNVTRFDRALVMGPLTTLTGREPELRRLTLLRESTRDQGAFILLRGEAGIGKSRLIQELHDREPANASTWFRCQCWPQFKDSAFHPFITWLQRFLEFSPEDTPEEKLRKLGEQLGAAGLPTEHVPPLASLLSLPLPEGTAFRSLPPEHQRERGVRALAALFQQLSEKRPLVFVVEDVHWADPSTLQFLGFLLESLERLRACFLLTTRPEFTHAWAGHDSFFELRLEPLSPQATSALIQETAHGTPLAAETIEMLVARTDGVPLFIEELTRMVVEQGGTGATAEGSLLPIPTTLHELLQARLDQLPAQTKALAQLAALLGREFSHDVLHAVSFLEEDELRQTIERLERAGLLFQQGWPPHLTYSFKHSLIQDAAYQSLTRSTRQHYHTRLFHVLSERFPTMAQEQPELLANHATRAGLSEQAVELWQRAGQLAASKSALAEAIHHFTRALEQLAFLPPSRERDEREITLRVELGQGLVSTKGFAAKEVEEVFTRAHELCEQYGEVPFSVLWGIWAVALVRGSREDTDQLEALFYRLLETQADATTQVVVHSSLGTLEFWRGHYAESLRHNTLAKQLSREDPSMRNLARIRGGGSQSYVAEQVLHAHLSGAFGESMLGNIDRARELCQEALALAEAMQHPYAVALTLSFAATIEYEVDEPEVARDLANRLIAVSTRNGFLFTLATGYCVLGWATARLGDPQAGIPIVQQGLGLLQAMGALLIYPTCLVCLLKAQLLAGQNAEGLAATKEGLSMLDTLLARRARGDLLRLQGEFLRQQGALEAARASMELALAEARDCGARLHELRAAASLARLLRQSGNVSEAHAVLAETCGRFPGGSELRDYKVARELLTELSGHEEAPGATPG